MTRPNKWFFKKLDVANVVTYVDRCFSVFNFDSYEVRIVFVSVVIDVHEVIVYSESR